MQTADVLERARDLNFPPIVIRGGGITGESAYCREAAFPGNLVSMAAQLDAIAAERDAAADRVGRWADADADRAAAATPLTEEEQREFTDEMRADFERHERERPRRMEALLVRVVELLEKAGK